MSLVHLHLLLNHWPIIGTFLALGLFLVALASRSIDLKKTSLTLFALVALLSIPTYVSGSAAQHVLQLDPNAPFTLIAAHQGAALLALIFIEITGAIAWFALWHFRRTSRPAAWISPAVLLSSIVTVGFLTIAGNTGGAIHHPEILAGPESASAVGTLGLRLDTATQQIVADSSRYIWPILEDIHFVGLALLLAGTSVLNLRVLGFLKQFPVGPLQRLIPWAVAGLFLNIVTGMLFFLGMPYFYVYNLDFHVKLFAVVLAGANLLFHCTPLFPDCTHLGPDTEASSTAKLFAGSSIVLWVAVIAMGRYMPYFEETLIPPGG